MSDTKVYLTPECSVATQRAPEFHAQCNYPGYNHPVLKWVSVECECNCHTASPVTDEASDGRSS